MKGYFPAGAAATRPRLMRLSSRETEDQLTAGRMAAPVRAYAKRYGASAQHVAFFCTEGGRGAESAFADLEKLCQHPPEATLVVDAAHLPAVEHHVALSRFTASLTSTRH